MTDQTDLGRIRRAALDRIERAERNFKIAFLAAAFWEALFLAAFLFAADFSNRVHLLLLIATVGSYTFVVLGIVGLGAHANLNAQRILKAIELLRNESPRE